MHDNLLLEILNGSAKKFEVVVLKGFWVRGLALISFE